MAVYVDALRAVRGAPRCFQGYACHMMADTDTELERMARKLGMQVRWRHGDHYDLNAARRSEAVTLGAIQVSSADLVRLRRKRREGI